MSEQFANLASSTLASAYTAGAGSISVASASSFPTSGTFTVVIRDQATKAIKLLFRVTSVAGATFSGAAEGTDTAANAGDLVDGTMVTVASLAQFKADILASAGGGGNTTSFGTTSNLPSTSGQTKGNRYVPTDSLIEEYIFDGSVWQPFIRGLNVITPAIADFGTSVVSTNASVSDFSNINGGIHFAAIRTLASGDNLAAKLKTFTAGKTYTMRFYPNIPGMVSGTAEVGMIMRDSASSKLYTFMVFAAGAQQNFLVQHWSNENTFNGTDYETVNSNLLLAWRGPITLRFVDDGSNYIFKVSTDGVNFETYFSVSHGSAFLTPNQIGLGVVPFDSSLLTAMTVCDFFQT